VAASAVPASAGASAPRTPRTTTGARCESASGFALPPPASVAIEHLAREPVAPHSPVRSGPYDDGMGGELLALRSPPRATAGHQGAFAAAAGGGLATAKVAFMDMERAHDLQYLMNWVRSEEERLPGGPAG